MANGMFGYQAYTLNVSVVVMVMLDGGWNGAHQCATMNMTTKNKNCEKYDVVIQWRKQKMIKYNFILVASLAYSHTWSIRVYIFRFRLNGKMPSLSVSLCDLGLCLSLTHSSICFFYCSSDPENILYSPHLNWNLNFIYTKMRIHINCRCQAWEIKPELYYAIRLSLSPFLCSSFA